MTRRWWMSSAFALGGCGEKAELPPGLFPQNAAGGWTLVQTGDLAPSDAPDPVPRNTIERLRGATYKSGDAEIQARVYLLTSDAVSATLATRWRPSADTVFFNHGAYFVVVKWQAADRKALRDFVTDLQSRLGAAKGTRS